MNYKEALQYLYDNIPMFHRIGPSAFKPDLSNINVLSDFLGNPHLDFKSIHIAGTNGKGSTAHTIAAVLQSAGFKVGLYTSPHYRDFRERIKLNGKYIPENEVISFVEKVRQKADEVKPSFFELTAAMAFHYFSKEKVDFAVIEVGMGGRLDATNIITPECSVITNIGFDHEQFLGDTLAKIASEKAGIIKYKIPVVIGEYEKDTLPVFQNISKTNQAEIFLAQDIYRIESISEHITGSTLDIYKNNLKYLNNLQFDLGGIYQLKNLKAVLSCLDVLNTKGYKISERDIRKGLSDVKSITNIIGRWHTLQKEKPTIICDSAHNSHGLKHVKSALKKIAHKQLHIVFGMVSDKDPQQLLGELPKNASYYFCKADIPRGLPAETLKEEASKIGIIGTAYSSVKAAFNAAKDNACEEDLIFVGGSIFVLSEII